MVASKQHRKQLLIFNQNVFDLTSCLLLVITYSVKICDIYLEGVSGYWLCMTLYSDNFVWCAINGSVINLLSITIERYLKVVYPIWSKKFLRKWVLYSAVAFAWIRPTAYTVALVFTTSGVINGLCFATLIWKSQLAALAHSIWYFMASFFVVVVCIFTFCYWRILAVIRRQAGVMAGHSGHAGSSTFQSQSTQIQSNVVKTMVVVSVFYVVAWMPVTLYYLITFVDSDVTFDSNIYYVLTFIAFLYICSNPFVYAVKFDPVTRILLDLIGVMMPQRSVGNAEMTQSGSATATVRSVQQRN